MARTLFLKKENTIRVTVLQEGAAVALAPDDEVLYNVLDQRGNALLAGFQNATSDAPGANWAKGMVSVTIDAKSDPAKFEDYKQLMLVVRFRDGQHIEQLNVLKENELIRSQLFVRDMAVPDMRRDQLLVAASGAMREVKLSDEYIWQKLRAAESEIAHKLRILLTPHQVFPNEPTEEEIAALKGMPYMVETPYDYSPHMYDRDKWGYFVTRQRPIISVQRLRFVLPSQDSQYFDIPLDWLKLDEKYGHVRLLPSTNASLVTSSMLGFTALTWQSIIPNMLNLTYQAGIKDAWNDYPELIDAIKKMAVVKILTDLFLPQSGSISADGLSESMSTDISKYQEQIDHIINGESGNGGLMAMFNGIRAIVM
ncbi:hypothetical protein GTB64_004472 [Salmonella enterica]|nr:hypothetical protein [Salmonella enterica]